MHGAVVVVGKIDGVAVNIREQLGADGVELRLGIAGRGIRHIARVDLAEVALGIDKRVQQRLVAARQTHHRLVDRGVAVRVQAHGLPDDVGGFCPRAGEQTHLVHRVQQLAVRRLKAVDLRDGARDDDRHRVGHIVLLQRLADRLLQNLRPQPLHMGVARVLDFSFFFLLRHDDSSFNDSMPSICSNQSL